MSLDEILTNDFQAFAFRAHIEFGQKLERADYLDFLSFRLQQFAAGCGPQRLLVSLPPRHLKTFLCSKALPAWILAHNPAAKIMIVTYSEALASDIAHATRAILDAPWFKKVFRTRLAKDRRRLLDFATNEGGGVFSTSIEGSITGRGADLIIIDDPVRISDYANLEKLEHINANFQSEIASRLNNPRRGRILVVAHRINECDLPGFLASQGGWAKITLPFHATRSRNFKFGDGRVWHRENGDFLLPFYRASDLARLRKTVVAPNFELLYQQNPKASNRLRIHAEDFITAGNIGDAPIVLSVDPGLKSGEASSYSCIQAWAYGKDVHTLVDVWRERVGFRELRKAVWTFIRRYVPSVVLIEGTASGPALAGEIRPQSNMTVEMVSPHGSKSERLKPHIGRIRAGQVALAQGPWTSDYIDELTRFPDADFDDQVDATTQYLSWAANNLAPTRRNRAIAARSSAANSAAAPSDGQQRVIAVRTSHPGIFSTEGQRRRFLKRY